MENKFEELKAKVLETYENTVMNGLEKLYGDLDIFRTVKKVAMISFALGFDYGYDYGCIQETKKEDGE